MNKKLFQTLAKTMRWETPFDIILRVWQE